MPGTPQIGPSEVPRCALMCKLCGAVGPYVEYTEGVGNRVFYAEVRAQAVRVGWSIWGLCPACKHLLR